jgi:hypothetical protein
LLTFCLSCICQLPHGSYVIYDARSVTGISEYAFSLQCVDENACRIALQYYNVQRLNQTDRPWETIIGGLTGSNFKNTFIQLRPISIHECTLRDTLTFWTAWKDLSLSIHDFIGNPSELLLPKEDIADPVSSSKRSSNTTIPLGRLDNLIRWNIGTLIRSMFQYAGAFSGIIITVPKTGGEDAIWKVTQ